MSTEARTANDFVKLKEVLTEGWYQRLLGQLKAEMDGKKQQLANVDLAEENGRLKAVKLQGEILGMSRYLDVLTEILEKETEE